MRLFTFFVSGPSAQCMSMDMEAALLAARVMAEFTGDNLSDYIIKDMDNPNMEARAADSKLVLKPLERLLTHA